MMKQDRRKPSWSVADRVRYNIQHHLEDAAPRVHRYVNSTSFFVRRMSDSLQKIPENGRPKSTEQQVVLQSKLILRDYLQWEVKRQKAASPHPLVTVSHIAPSSPYRDDSAGDPLATTATTTSSPHKLEEKDDVIGNLLKLTISDCSDVSQQVIAMGRELELRYPNIFKGVANNLRLNLSSPNQLITAYQTVSQELFRFGITWLRIVALIVITKSLFLECAIEGNDQHSFNLVEAFQRVVRRRLSDWIINHGGWVRYYCAQ
ncbi:putative bcl-2-related ovarian killer protein [Apostichopus japonicus]|uniref:Putative bcl-2-related ovarian killer protein n=1 Tax=Stichopus japonicus TaxID=307972 RepID=A0A2G8KLW4_STIJA|nr:putative bcl-2-related ovarian killer protein [Apostichopus japonicus]